jgi:hypothetical protein
MKTLMFILILAFSVTASQVVFTQEKPTLQKTERAEHKPGNKEKKAEKKLKKAEKKLKKAEKKQKRAEKKEHQEKPR